MFRVRNDRERLRSYRIQNILHTVLLLLGMGGLLGGVGYLVFGATGLFWGLFFLGVSSWMMPRLPEHLLLRWMGASEVAEWEAPGLYREVEILAKRAELPTLPVLYWLPTPEANAMAMGSVEAPYLVVTEGLLQALNTRQLRGVLAHEISHIKNGDLSVMRFAQQLERMTSMLSHIGVFLLIFSFPIYLFQGQPFPLGLLLLLWFAPTLVQLMLLGLSRTREFEADRQAAALTEDPLGLASALETIASERRPWWEQVFFPRRRIKEDPLWRSHPPTKARIERLKSLVEVEAIPVSQPQRRRYPVDVRDDVFPFRFPLQPARVVIDEQRQRPRSRRDALRRDFGHGFGFFY